MRQGRVTQSLAPAFRHVTIVVRLALGKIAMRGRWRLAKRNSEHHRAMCCHEVWASTTASIFRQQLNTSGTDFAGEHGRISKFPKVVRPRNCSSLSSRSSRMSSTRMGLASDLGSVGRIGERIRGWPPQEARWAEALGGRMRRYLCSGGRQRKAHCERDAGGALRDSLNRRNIARRPYPRGSVVGVQDGSLKSTDAFVWVVLDKRDVGARSNAPRNQ